MANNTGNPIGSDAYPDFQDNVQNLDHLVAGDALSWADRFGKQRKSWHGLELDFSESQEVRETVFQKFIEGSGWSVVGAYEAGVILYSHTQAIIYNGQPYTVKPSIPVSVENPYIVEGEWLDESENFKLVGDNSLRQDLSTGDGSLVSLEKGILSQAIRFVTPEQFGCSTTAQDNRTNLQAALDYAALHKIELRSNSDFDVKGPVYLPSFNCVWIGTGKIRNTYDGSENQRKLCFYPGTYNPVYFGMLSYKLCETVQAGDSFVVMSSVAEAASFSAGDMVFYRVARHYNGADGEIPLFATNNRVVSVDLASGRIELEYPILKAASDGRIAKTSGTGIMDALGERELYCCYGARVEGISFESVNGHITERGGMLGCNIDIPSAKGLSGIYSNAVNFSRWKVGRVDCDSRIFETGGCTSGSVLEIDTAVWRKTDRSSERPLISINENMSDNRVVIGNVSAPDFDYSGQPFLHILSANENDINIDRVQIPKGAGNAFVFENLTKNAAGESQPSTSGNHVFCGMFVGGSALQRFCLMSNAGGLNSDNTLDGYFIGSPANGAVTMAGSGQKVLGRYTGGAVNLNVAIDSTVDVRAPGGVTGFTRSSGNIVVQGGVSYEVKPRISSKRITPIMEVNGGGATAQITPDLSRGTVQSVPFNSATALRVNNPVGATEGDEFYLELKNNNTSTAVAPSFGTAYLLFGEAVTAIQPGRRALYKFSVMENLVCVLELQRSGFI